MQRHRQQYALQRAEESDEERETYIRNRNQHCWRCTQESVSVKERHLELQQERQV